MSIFGWSYPPGAADDPNAPYNQDSEDWGLDLAEVRTELKALSTGRWEWDKIDCCMTGKDADLEPWGDQGIELVSADEDKITCMARIMKTFAGDDVCLNTPWDLAPEAERERLEERAVSQYLDAAQEIVCGCSVPGEWDGDSWVMSEAVEFSVPWVMSGDGVTPDYAATARSAALAADSALEPVVAELKLADDAMNLLAGWSTLSADGSIIKTTAGNPGPEAAWSTGDDDNE